MRGRRLLFFACVAAAAFSSGPGYLLQVAQAGRATDFTRDFVAAAWLGAGQPLTRLDGVAGNAAAVRLGADPVLMPCGPFHLHPPPASMLVRPLVPLGFRSAAIAWLLLSLTALAVLGHVLVDLLHARGARPPPRLSLAAFVGLVAWPPAIMNIAFGQWSILLATLMAVGWWGIERGRPRLPVAAFAAAIALKTTPAVVLGYFALRRRRLLVGVVGLIALIVLVSWPFVGGADAWRAFLRDGRPCVVCWQAYVDNTVSINGIFARLLVGGRYVRAAFDAPALARLLAPAAALALLGVAAALTLRHARRPTAEQAVTSAAGGPATNRVDAVDFAMWATLIALLNPLSWTHNAVFLLLPAALLVRDARHPATRWATAVAFVVLSVPRETLFRLAGPLPFAPGRASILGLHAVAGLALFACAAWESHRSQAGSKGLFPRGRPPDPR